ncbi:MAG: serine hydrolase domain-containing protein [Polyangiaceae bacterium]
MSRRTAMLVVGFSVALAGCADRAPPAPAHSGADDEAAARPTPVIAPSNPGATRLDVVDAVVERTVPTDGPGAVVLVAQDGVIVHEAAYGMADLERKQPMEVGSAFNLASCSKQFTAHAVALLVERGQLSLDDDVRKYIPELPVYDKKRPIQLRDLVYMIAGLPEYFELFDELTTETNDAIVSALAKQSELAAPTGTKYEYSNSAYVMLATVVQRVSKKSFGDFLGESIWRPAGMTHTHLERLGDDTVQGYARSDAGAWEIDRDPTPGVVGDGGVVSTVEDLYKYDQAMRADKLVKQSTKELMLAPGKLDSGAPLDYAFGLMLWEEEGERVAWHDGSWNGTATYFARHQEQNRVVVVLMNQTDAEAAELGSAIEEAIDAE